MAVQIQLRRDTTANWTSENPTLAQGEIGLDLTSGGFKIGDGATAWASLPYHGGVAWGAITGTLSGQTDLQAALDGKLGLLSPPQNYSSDRTLDSSNSGRILRFTDEATVTLPDGLADGFQCVIVNATDSDTVDLDAETTLTLPSGFEPEVVNRRAVTLLHVGSNVWEAYGALVETP